MLSLASGDFWIVLAVVTLFTLCVSGGRSTSSNRSSFLSLFLWRNQQQQQQQQSSPRTKQDSIRDAESRQMAKQAALKRQEKHETLQRQRRQRRRQEQDATSQSPPPPVTTTTTALAATATAPTTINSTPIITTTPFPLPLVCEHDGIKFYHMSHLPHANRTAALIRRLAREFLPIIQRRGYCVLTVSEMCCCGDALDTGELGGHLRRVSATARINGRPQEEIFGYNRTIGGARGSRTMMTRMTNTTRHSIHLRLRHANHHHHDVMFPYEQVAQTMCHELAHCVHSRGHSPAFYQLETEIKLEYATRNNSNNSNGRGDASGDGFDIYQSRTSRMYWCLNKRSAGEIIHTGELLTS